MKNNLILALLVSVALVGCGSQVRLDDRPASIENRSDGAGTDGANSGGATGTGIDDRNIDAQGSDRDVAAIDADQLAAVDPLDDPDSLLAQRSIFFDYDSFTINEQYRELVEAHARYLVDNPARKVVLQGNTDERGSREYNLALGQKRAEAVARALAVLGVNPAQVEAVSFGEERPRSVSQTEDAYAENRRTDLEYQ